MFYAVVTTALNCVRRSRGDILSEPGDVWFVINMTCVLRQPLQILSQHSLQKGSALAEKLSSDGVFVENAELVEPVEPIRVGEPVEPVGVSGTIHVSPEPFEPIEPVVNSSFRTIMYYETNKLSYFQYLIKLSNIRVFIIPF